ncbi:hypothetical protein XELAEV_18033140mg [Xenopus laevis]|uniref:Uncharacterized protein n=1 Tax=Xenopus laevis TaxID=8355 RepID=A0A974CJ11_XENLA|nr:hypothetical protein XELAEV_18033140mg [Xenopus laevis]
MTCTAWDAKLYIYHCASLYLRRRILSPEQVLALFLTYPSFLNRPLFTPSLVLFPSASLCVCAPPNNVNCPQSLSMSY